MGIDGTDIASRVDYDNLVTNMDTGNNPVGEMGVEVEGVDLAEFTTSVVGETEGSSGSETNIPFASPSEHAGIISDQIGLPLVDTHKEIIFPADMSDGVLDFEASVAQIFQTLDSNGDGFLNNLDAAGGLNESQLAELIHTATDQVKG